MKYLHHSDVRLSYCLAFFVIAIGVTIVAVAVAVAVDWAFAELAKPTPTMAAAKIFLRFFIFLDFVFKIGFTLNDDLNKRLWDNK